MEDFTEDDKNNIQETALKFPTHTQLSVAKICEQSVHFYGTCVTGSKTTEPTDNAQCLFEIGSITKVFTSHLLAQLVTEDKVNLDDPIDKYLGYSLNKNAVITLRELSNHTAGLPRLPLGMFWEALFKNRHNPYKDFSTERLEHYLKHALKQKKRGKSRYSNLGAGLLGFTLSKITNTNYETMLKNRIFLPLNMHQSSTQRDTLQGQIVKGRNKKGLETSHWDLASLEGAGAILSSVSDLAKFVQAGFNKNNKAHALQHRPTVKLNDFEQMGLGWVIRKHKITENRSLHWHNGGTGGYYSIMVTDIEHKTGVVILSNVSGLFLMKAENIAHLAFNILKDM
ncbi:serine hydrolase domain-containing protein [Kordiimonas aquimaris]|uniref:serine hydrolase domain-containing protein n=1 Tax=Kordiimonas aquimaris TaxID=707591 RepID=UPI0021D1AE3A|nr:serine hydrolase domain-containing protein [Kordiimonas aquimaris]